MLKKRKWLTITLLNHFLYNHYGWTQVLSLKAKHYISKTSWVKSGLLYIKDIFNDNGLLKSSEQIIDILNKKSNWICEYKIIQQVFKKYEHLFDYSKIPYIVLQPLSMDKQYSTKIFYAELVKAKFQPPISIAKWNTEFDISEKKKWESIFLNKIKNVKDTFLAESIINF